MAKKRTTKSLKAKRRTHVPAIGGLSLAGVWPQERDFMERPERYKYVRKIVQPDGCVFCKALDMKASYESLTLYRDAQVMVMLNKYPYNNGHLLILPVRHTGDLLSLSEGEFLALQRILRKSARAIVDAFNCPGFNIGLNHGKVAGAGIEDHLHWHIVPRWAGDTNFFPLIAETKVLPETLEESYKKLKPHFVSN